MSRERLEKTRDAVRQKWDPCFTYVINRWVPWASLRRPLSECRVALVSSAGVHLKSQEPFDSPNPLGDWTFRRIPRDAEPEDLAIAHTHYDHRYADEDLNVVFPLWRLRELEERGIIGQVAEANYSFMGYIPEPTHLVSDTAPEVAQELREAEVDAVVLNPV